MHRETRATSDYNPCRKSDSAKKEAKSRDSKTLLVIGGGMAGLTAAIFAMLSWEGSTPLGVILLDANKEPGKKLLVTGNGRCNITNLVQNESCYRSSAKASVTDSFFTDCTCWSERLLAFLHGELGVLTHDRQGYVYPRSDQAATIQKALLRKADALGIQIVSGVRVTSVRLGSDESKNRTFAVEAAGLSSETPIFADAVVLATGGMVSKAYGCVGDGYRFAQAFGHAVTPTFPALCMLRSEDEGFQRLSGVRTTGEIHLYSDGQLLSSGKGELQFTADGISGIPTFQVSRYAAGADKAHPMTAVIDFLPELSEPDWNLLCQNRLEKALDEISVVKQSILDNRPIRSTPSLQEFLLGLVPDKVAAFLVERCGEIPERKIYKLAHPKKTLDRLLAMARHTTFSITGTPGFEKAQVTAGGVSLSDIGTNMESAKVPGLYLAGELLDVDGICGGYNLTFAFHSGAVAGKSAAERLKKENGDNQCWN